MTRRKLYLVGCGAAKLERPARARELYTGSLFVAARRFVEARRERWRILSARYGLVHPDTVLPPYNQRLWRRKEERAQWALIAASGIRYENAGAELHVVFLCGAEYADPRRCPARAVGRDNRAAARGPRPGRAPALVQGAENGAARPYFAS